MESESPKGIVLPQEMEINGHYTLSEDLSIPGNAKMYTNIRAGTPFKLLVITKQIEDHRYYILDFNGVEVSLEESVLEGTSISSI